MRTTIAMLLRALFACLCVFALAGAASADTLHPVDPDANRNFTQIIQAKGYPVETHNVTTEDGYILTVFRMPNPTGLPVLLQHGLLDSSFTWILNEPNQSLPYLLWDRGYDVWMGNNRGNLYSKSHVSLNPDSKEFWQFSWDQVSSLVLSSVLVQQKRILMIE